jgi:hypothetical protein
MIEKDDKFQSYANDLVINVPGEYIDYLIALFMRYAAINMGVEVNPTTLESTIYYIKKDYGYIPVNFIASAFIKGSLGKIGDGKGRLVPKTILTWLGDTSLEYNRMIAKKRESDKLNDVSIAMDLHQFPVGKAIMQKIDWLRSGKITADEWDLIPLKELAERIGSHQDYRLNVFGIKDK